MQLTTNVVTPRLKAAGTLLIAWTIILVLIKNLGPVVLEASVWGANQISNLITAIKLAI